MKQILCSYFGKKNENILEKSKFVHIIFYNQFGSEKKKKKTHYVLILKN